MRANSHATARSSGKRNKWATVHVLKVNSLRFSQVDVGHYSGSVPARCLLEVGRYRWPTAIDRTVIHSRARELESRHELSGT